ncbi:MAG: hypothetical protein ABSE90_00795 [Verrucomicrobiota bacterium]
MKTLKILSLVMAVAMVATVELRAGDTRVANPFFGTLSAVSPAELPAKSAELVSQADSKNCVETTINVVKAAVGLNPAAAATIVGTIAQSTPKMASVAAATAAALVPEQAIAIARAAAVAAPSEAGKIVEAVCRVVPSAYKDVANAVAGVVPGAGKAILAGVSAAIPSLQEPIAKVLAASNGGNPIVGPVLAPLPSILPATTTPLSANAAPLPPITPSVHFKPAPPISPVDYSSPGSGSGVELPGGHTSPP